MFEKKDRKKIIERYESEKHIIDKNENTSNIKKRSISIYEENLEKLISINNYKEFNMVKNGFEIPNLKKTLGYIFDNFDYDLKIESIINTCQNSKMITLYLDNDTIKNIEHFANINNIFKGAKNININLACNYIIKYFSIKEN